MTLEERGAYITLLAWSWERGGVPNDMKRLAVILGADLEQTRTVLDEVLKRWYLDDVGAWRNRRLELVRETQKTFSQSQADKGKRGAQTRWGRRAADKIAGANSPTNDPAIAGLVTDAVPGQSPDDSSPISDLRSLPPLRKERSEGEIARAPEVVGGIAWRKPDSPESARYRHGEPLIQPVNEQRFHQEYHAWCSARICVPLRLHFEFVGRLVGDNAAERLRAWYPTVVARYDGRDFGDDVFQFWKNEFAGWVGTVTSRPNPSGSRTGDSMDAAKVSLRRRLEKLQAEEGHEDRALESGEGSPDSQRHRALVQRPPGKALA